jgi:glycosyltransferase involved in cell wall biosynthesis
VSASPSLTIVIPTHNRVGKLMGELEALSHQTWPMAEVDVIVVADACLDDTVAQAQRFAATAPYPLRVLAHEARSLAMTRNLGAAHARGTVLLFVDDDILPDPGFVRAHMEAQAPGRVVIGYSKPVPHPRPSWWQLSARLWWEDSFTKMARPGHRYTCWDFFGGNTSMPVELFQAAGEFDGSFTGAGYEDYEFGYRLLQAGARFHFVRETLGHHRDETDLPRWLGRLRQEGWGAIKIGTKHPELRRRLLPDLESSHRVQRLAIALAFVRPTLAVRLAGLVLRLARVLEWMRWRRAWWGAFALLRALNQWAGVASAIKTRGALESWLQEGASKPAAGADAPVLDLGALPGPDDLDAALARGDRSGVRVEMAGLPVMTVHPIPGAEPLREEHLRAAVRELAGAQFVPALALRAAAEEAAALSTGARAS